MSLCFAVRQLLLAAPDVFFQHLPESISDKIPDIQKLVQNVPLHFDETNLLAYLQSSAGESFLHFSKSAEFGKGE